MKTTKLPSAPRIPTANGNGNGSTPKTVSAAVEIPQLSKKTIQVKIVGKSALIVHAWSAKAVRMMLDKQMGKASAGREKKDPLADFQGSLYYLPNKQGFGLPAPAFKAAIVTAANDVGMKMTETKRSIHVNSYLVPIIAEPLDKADFTDYDHEYLAKLKFEHKHGCSMRCDMVRLESGVADIRFRGQFPKWGAVLEIEYNERVITAEQVVNLVNCAGYGCGVGEWRPSSPQVRSGEYGRFEVEMTK